jgi:hypothetical protein
MTQGRRAVATPNPASPAPGTGPTPESPGERLAGRPPDR